MSFSNRVDAGRQLARALSAYKDRDPIVLALPRGGVPVAAEVAAALHAPLDLVVVRKIGVPTQPELAMGAVVEGAEPIVVRNDDVICDARVSSADFEMIRKAELAEIGRRHERYIGTRTRAEPAGRTVIVVDDGVATGATVRAALRAVRARRPKWLVLAVPVGPITTLEELRREADDVVCLEEHERFGAIGYFYADFRPTTDEEVVKLLARHPVEQPRRQNGPPTRSAA